MSVPLPVASTRRTRRALGTLLRRHVVGFTFAILALLAAAMASVATPLLLGAVVDAASGPTDDRTEIVPLFVGLSALVVVLACLAVWSRVAVARVGERMLAKLRVDVFSHVLRLPERRIEAAGRGEVISRVTSDVAIVGQTTSTVLPGTASAAFLVAGSAAGLALIDPRLTVAALLAVPLQVLALRLYLRRSQPLYRASREEAGARSQHILEALEARRAIVAFGAGPGVQARIDDVARREADLTMSAARVGAQFWGRLNIAEFVGLAAILAVGWMLVATGSATIGAATAAALLFMQLFGPISTILASFDDLQRAGASLARLVGILDEPDAVTRKGEYTLAPPGIAVSMKDVGFAYEDREALGGITLELRDAGHLAVVGASGAGKSTLASLVTGELAPTRGQLALGGENPRIGLVNQENHVFSGSLRNDLTIGKPDADADELHQALSSVSATEWFSRLPAGLETTVGAGGLALTDTQRQQLALARMWLFDPDILILDEATSEADATPSGELAAAASLLTSRHTTITIAHRLDQAQSADTILVLEDGRVVETGNHADLLAANGPYRRLWDTWRQHRTD